MFRESFISYYGANISIPHNLLRLSTFSIPACFLFEFLLNIRIRNPLPLSPAAMGVHWGANAGGQMNAVAAAAVHGGGGRSARWARRADGFGGPEVFCFCFFYSINRGGHKTTSKNVSLTVT